MNSAIARMTRLLANREQTPDAELVTAYLSGSQTAFGDLVQRHGELVFRVCYRLLRHRQDAEDAFQAVFLVLARRANDIWPREAVGSWLYGVAYRVALKSRALRAKRQVMVPLNPDFPQREPTVPDVEVAAIVERAVSKLPDVYRAAIVACDLQGLTRGQAAKQLGWSEGTLSGRLSRARKLLASRLRNQGVSLPGAGFAALFGAPEPLRAGLVESTIHQAINAAILSISGPLAALTQGVVPSMIVYQFKAATAAVLIVSSLCYGAWSANGGDGPASALAPTKKGAPAPLTQAKPAKNAQQPLSPGLQQLQGRWLLENHVFNGKPLPLSIPGQDQRLIFEFVDYTMRARDRQDLDKLYSITVDTTKNPNEIDISLDEELVAKGIFEITRPKSVMTCANCHQEGSVKEVPRTFLLPFQIRAPHCQASLAPPNERLRLALNKDGKRPTQFDPNTNLEEFTLTRISEKAAPSDLPQKGSLWPDRPSELKQKLDHAETAVLEHQRYLELANEGLNKAKQELELARKRFEDARKLEPQPGDKPQQKADSFTIHIRSLDAPESAIRVKATGNETILDGMVQAAREITLKPEGLTVWIVRGKQVLPVDLVGITQRGITKTNYQLHAGDQIFVQVKPTW